MDRIPHSKSISCYRAERLRISNSQRKPLELSLAGLCRLCTQHPTAESHQTVGFHRPKCKERLKPGANSTKGGDATLCEWRGCDSSMPRNSVFWNQGGAQPIPTLQNTLENILLLSVIKLQYYQSSHLDVEESLVPWPLGLHAPIDQHMQSRLHLLHHSPWQPEFKIKRPNT